MASYNISKLIEVGVEGQLVEDNGQLPDFSRSVGSTGWGVAVRVGSVIVGRGSDYAQVWAQPCILAANPLSGPATPELLPIGGAGQLIIPGPTYVWSRRELALDTLAASASAASQIDLAIALWRARGSGVLNVRVYRVTV